MTGEAAGEPCESALTSGQDCGCAGRRIRLRCLRASIFESRLAASHRYPLFHTDRFNSNIGLPMPPARPRQNAAKARNRRPSDLRSILLSVRFTSSYPGIWTLGPNPSRLFLNSHTNAPGPAPKTPDVKPPSHRDIRVCCMSSGRLAVQALPGGLVARIIIANEANGPGCQLPVYAHPFVAVRRSLRTRFAIGQRSILASFAVRHFGAP